MSLDTHGIYQYDETEDEATFSELLNLLAASVSESKAAFRGLAVQRAAIDPVPPGATFQEIDGQKRLYSASPGGGWRLHEGKVTAAAAAWDVSVAPAYGRSITVTFPTVLASTEVLQISLIDVPGIWATVTISALTRSPTNTTATVYLARLFNASTMPVTLAWRIVSVGP